MCVKRITTVPHPSEPIRPRLHSAKLNADVFMEGWLWRCEGTEGEHDVATPSSWRRCRGVLRADGVLLCDGVEVLRCSPKTAASTLEGAEECIIRASSGDEEKEEDEQEDGKEKEEEEDGATRQLHKFTLRDPALKISERREGTLHLASARAAWHPLRTVSPYTEPPSPPSTATL